MNENLIANIKRLIKHTAIYGLGGILYRAAALVLLPVFARYLNASEYGDYELLFTTSTFLFLIMQLGMGSAIFRSIIYKENSDEPLIISTSFYFLLAANILIVGLLCLFSETISLAIFTTPDKAYLLRLIFIADLFEVMITIPQTKLRIDESSTLYTLIALGNFIVRMGLTIYFLMTDSGVTGVIWAQFINSFIFFLVYTLLIINKLQFRFSWTELKEMLGYGLPFVPASIGTSILMLSNRYFLRHYESADEVGYFSAGYRIAQIIALVVNAFQMAWPTLLFSIAKEKDAPRTYSKLLTYLTFVLVSMTLGISIFGKEILYFVVSPEYVVVEHIIPLLNLANVFWGVFYMTSIGIQIQKKTIYVPVTTGIAAAANLALNFWLISMPGFALYGAAISSLAGNVIMALSALVISLKFYYIRYEYRKISWLFAIGTITYLVAVNLPIANIIILIILKLVLFTLFFVILYFAHFFTPQ
jgi:O-antigen/teichoic acid export membrane protein